MKYLLHFFHFWPFCMHFPSVCTIGRPTGRVRHRKYALTFTKALTLYSGVRFKPHSPTDPQRTRTFWTTLCEHRNSTVRSQQYRICLRYFYIDITRVVYGTAYLVECCQVLDALAAMLVIINPMMEYFPGGSCKYNISRCRRLYTFPGLCFSATQRGPSLLKLWSHYSVFI